MERLLFIFMKIFNKNYLLLIVLFISFVLRIYNLNTLPALNADEAAIGYNVFSLILTGKDEHGNIWPVNFQSFNDYKPGLYFYLAIPFVKFFGLNVMSVRLPGLIFGLIGILGIYYLSFEIFRESKNKKVIALVSALMLAISPWHIHFSRGAWEVNVCTTFLMFLVYFYLKYQRTDKFRNYICSLIFYILVLYTYHSGRVIGTLIFISLHFIFYKNLFKRFYKIFLTLLISLVFLIPLGGDLLNGKVLSRAQGVGIFSDLGPLNRINELRGQQPNPNSIITRLVFNRFTGYGSRIFTNYFSHFSFNYLFVNGDEIQRNKVPGFGQLYLYVLPFLFLGLFYLFKDRLNKRGLILLLMLLLAPIPASLTFQAPHALRSAFMIIPLTIIFSYGVVRFYNILNRKYIFIAKVVTFSTLLIFFFLYLNNYYKRMSQELPFSSQYGVFELVDYLNSTYKNDDRLIFVTDRYDQPYILFLFYLNYSPVKFQSEGVLSVPDAFGFSTVSYFDKFRFGKINLDDIKKQKINAIVVGTSEEITQSAYPNAKEIKGVNSYTYFRIIEI